MLAISTLVLAIVGAWALCLALGAGALALLGVGSGPLAAGAGIVGAVASVAIVGAEGLANRSWRHRR